MKRLMLLAAVATAAGLSLGGAAAASPPTRSRPALTLASPLATPRVCRNQVGAVVPCPPPVCHGDVGQVIPCPPPPPPVCHNQVGAVVPCTLSTWLRGGQNGNRGGSGWVPPWMT